MTERRLVAKELRKMKKIIVMANKRFDGYCQQKETADQKKQVIAEEIAVVQAKVTEEKQVMRSIKNRSPTSYGRGYSDKRPQSGEDRTVKLTEIIKLQANGAHSLNVEEASHIAQAREYMMLSNLWKWRQ